MPIESTSGPVVVGAGEDGGAPLGSSGRARLKVVNRPPGEPGYAIVEAVHPSGEPRIRDHIHARHDETFMVIEGEYEVRLDDKIVTAGAGDYVFVPRGTAHTYRNAGAQPARVVNIISPADGVDLLAELGALASAALEPTALAELHRRHSATVVDPLPDW
ncbi:MAG: cupin domain-containing protein [Propionibacteriales bacterium]|nr:cupin domain-containing protein [Propionibacteriales bacterium]